MADINALVSLGIGSPASIEHFVLFGLNSAPAYTGSFKAAAFAITPSLLGAIDSAPALLARIETEP